MKCFRYFEIKQVHFRVVLGDAQLALPLVQIDILHVENKDDMQLMVLRGPQRKGVKEILSLGCSSLKLSHFVSSCLETFLLFFHKLSQDFVSDLCPAGNRLAVGPACQTIHLCYVVT